MSELRVGDSVWVDPSWYDEHTGVGTLIAVSPGGLVVVQLPPVTVCADRVTKQPQS